MRFEIDMQPFAARRFGAFHGQRHHPRGVTLPLRVAGHHGVEQKGVHAAVPGDIDETDQRLRMAQAHPTQTVPVDLAPPIIRQHGMTESFGMQCIHLAILERAAPFEAVIVLLQKIPSRAAAG